MCIISAICIRSINQGRNWLLHGRDVTCLTRATSIKYQMDQCINKDWQNCKTYTYITSLTVYLKYNWIIVRCLMKYMPRQTSAFYIHTNIIYKLKLYTSNPTFRQWRIQSPWKPELAAHDRQEEKRAGPRS